MCFMPKPKIPQPVSYQQSKEPVYADGNSASDSRDRRGRRGTILTSGPTPKQGTSMGGGAGQAMQPTSVAAKRTVLGA